MPSTPSTSSGWSFVAAAPPPAAPQISAKGLPWISERVAAIEEAEEDDFGDFAEAPPEPSSAPQPPAATALGPSISPERKSESPASPGVSRSGGAVPEADAFALGTAGAAAAAAGAQTAVSAPLPEDLFYTADSLPAASPRSSLPPPPAVLASAPPAVAVPQQLPMSTPFGTAAMAGAPGRVAPPSVPFSQGFPQPFAAPAAAGPPASAPPAAFERSAAFFGAMPAPSFPAPFGMPNGYSQGPNTYQQASWKAGSGTWGPGTGSGSGTWAGAAAVPKGHAGVVAPRGLAPVAVALASEPAGTPLALQQCSW